MLIKKHLSKYKSPVLVANKAVSWEKKVCAQLFNCNKFNFGLYDYDNQIRLFCGTNESWNSAHIKLLISKSSKEGFIAKDTKVILEFIVDYMEADPFDESDKSFWYIKSNSDLNIDFKFIGDFFKNSYFYNSVLSKNILRITQKNLLTEDKLNQVLTILKNNLKAYGLKNPDKFIF